MRVVSLMLRKHLINLTEAVTKIERVSEELQDFSLVISCLGMGVARVPRVNASEPTVGWRGEHPHSVGWIPLVIYKYSHTM
jgi:hypothetical protein